MNDNKHLNIGEAARYLGVSIDTLRRWDKNGKLSAKRSEGSHRFYLETDLELFKNDTFALATNWILGPAMEPESRFYCPTSSEFKGRLSKLQSDLEKLSDLKEYYPLIVAIIGEIGNNSFDHNLGNWPDISGIFFSYDCNKRQIALADRGQGVLRTLKRIKPNIKNDEEALFTAFTEVISGRAPEARGNGLKFVLEIVLSKEIEISFFSGVAMASVTKAVKNLNISKTDLYYSGCLVLIKF
ncbi:helix-turn-helix domain-containing protein [Candidatus Parcubacteria bacterium]|nr:helix-turn-helix domain-containing protein [Patescibacteria group bacterium]MCG2689362.1 helix-turn-helix domain-containing protein [Candidatus Parcubacteria bacterium]